LRHLPVMLQRRVVADLRGFSQNALADWSSLGQL
jgi:hypothetical protein